MSARKLVTVYGATGNQGGSVVASLLQNKAQAFSLRAITRNPESEKAKKLAAQGVEVVKADGFNRDQMLDAFRDSWAVFVNTNSDDPALHRPGAMTENSLGKLLVDTAAESGVQHFIYSGLVSAKLLTNGAVASECFDEKHAIGEYAKSRGVFKSVTIISAGWYMENNLNREFAAKTGGFPLEADDKGYLTMRVPRWGGTDEMPFIAIDDWGDFIHGILLDPESYSGNFIHGFGDRATPEQMFHTFQTITGKKSRFVPVDWKSIDTRGDPELETVKSMFGFLQHCGGRYYGEADDLSLARELKARATAAKGLPEEQGMLMTLDRWLRKHFSPESGEQTAGSGGVHDV